MNDPRKALKQSIDEVLWKVQELEATAGDFDGNHTLLQQRLDALVKELGKLQESGSQTDARVPTELLAYIDEGGNPDAYTAEVFARGNRANQLAKGKVQALQLFRDALKQQLAAAYPAEAAAYTQLEQEALGRAAQPPEGSQP